MTTPAAINKKSDTSDAVIDWLMDGDPAIRWQVMRDLFDVSESVWQTERARVESEGWGARLLAAQDADGQWAGGSFVPRDFDWSTIESAGQPWTATTWALSQLREFGFDPTTARAQRTVQQIATNSRWDHDSQPFWEGEVEECINGRAVADGAYYGVDVSPIVERLLDAQQEDGGWNCERENGSTRGSYPSTINVLEGLLEYEQATGGSDATRTARASGEAFLLQRNLFRRLSTGEPAADHLLLLIHPSRWYYDALRALDYFRAAGMLHGALADPRLGEAIEHVHSKRQADGRWLLDWTPRGANWFDMNDGIGQPSRWITLRARRVLRWWDAAQSDTTA